MPELTPAKPHAAAHVSLRRELGVFGATMMGLGSIVGTGIFVSVGIAAGVTGPSVIVAIAIAAFVAMCNAFSSAQLAASHPVSGGTYEYGYEYLRPEFGFSAGWMFLCAKSASAATAALGFAGYLLHMFRWSEALLVPTAVAVTAVLTAIVLSGIRLSNVTNVIIVSVTLASLLGFMVAGLPSVREFGAENLVPFFTSGTSEHGEIRGFLYATALMFVAYTGYGRIATLGEEVREPRRTIPRAIVLTLIVSAALYVGVAIVAIGAVGSAVLAQATEAKAAPLEIIAERFATPGVRWVVAVGALTAMVGVLLNLILGLSRVLLAMGRRRDAPSVVAKIDSSGSTPWVAVSVVGVAVAGIAAVRNIETVWSFSAFTVLVYYAITNLAALRLPQQHRLYPRFFAWCGLFACLFLAFWVDWHTWSVGLGLLVAGLVWHWTGRRLREG